MPCTICGGAGHNRATCPTRPGAEANPQDDALISGRLRSRGDVIDTSAGDVTSATGEPTIKGKSKGKKYVPSKKQKADSGASSSSPSKQCPEDWLCPVCFGIPLPPIWQCKDGHLLCSTCLPKLQKQECPTCKTSLDSTPIRNRAIENALGDMKVKVTCAKCTKPVLYGDCIEHTKSCGVVGSVAADGTLTIFDGVTHIPAEAFRNREDVTSLHMPDSVTTIGEYAFSGTGIKHLRIDKNITTIGRAAFACLNKCRSILFAPPSALEIIPEYCFSESLVFDPPDAFILHIPASVKSIGDGAFWGCNNIGKLLLEHGLQSIGKVAFKECAGLRQLWIPETVKEIKVSAFSDCNIKILSVRAETYSLVAIGDRAFYKNCIESLNLPDSILHMGIECFRHNSLTSVRLPYNLRTVSRYCFADNRIGVCYGGFGPNLVRFEHYAFAHNLLPSLQIPASLEYIGKYSFAHNLIKTLTFTGIQDSTSKLEIIESNAFDTNRIENLQLPFCLNFIGHRAFADNQIKEFKFIGYPVSFECSTSILHGNPIKRYKIGLNVMLNDDGQDSSSEQEVEVDAE